jgi:uncharacterized ubiquitin-like protein YukD
VTLDEMTIADMAAIAKIKQKNNCDKDEAISMYSDAKKLVDKMFEGENLSEEELAKRRIKIFQTIMG